MRHNNRRFFNEREETKKMLYISASILGVVILAFIITFVVYSNILKNDEQLAQINEKKITDLAKTVENTETEQASTSIGKSVNEVQSENTVETQTSEETTKIAINTSNMVKEESKDTREQNTTTSNTTTTNKVEEEVVEKEPSFAKPVEGEIQKEFAKDTLVYSETLKEWITHTGIDIKADKTTVVKAAEEGTVKSIKNDPRYGITVVIEHSKGYTTVYSNLLTAEFVKEGEKVKQSQTIGTVGNTATFEIADDYHLHFEILKDGENVNPSLYIK